jgi:hypothetical protein
MLAKASCFRWPSSSIRPREGRERSSKWEIRLVVLRLVDDQLALFLGRGVGRLLLHRLGRQIGVLLFNLQHRILLHLLLDPLLELHDRQLEDLHRLDHPRSQHLLLNESEILAERKSHLVRGWGLGIGGSVFH